MDGRQSHNPNGLGAVQMHRAAPWRTGASCPQCHLLSQTDRAALGRPQPGIGPQAVSSGSVTADGIGAGL